MKILTKVFLVIALVGLGSFAHAQALKIGYIDSNEIMGMMPERDTIENKLVQFEKQLENELRAMATEYQTKLADYQTNLATMSNLIRQSKEKELTDLQTRIQDFQQNADMDYSERRNELLTPLIDKVKKAIEDVGSEDGYTYIIDSATGVLLHIGTGADDVTPKVKTKLGI
ncbi:MAG: OmpH family outer membrane protein [Bacteroidales bacterium]|jgi:outer membrane protein|nr:OmpH family outer membrane protein [Bacteroidales bacterium]MDN5349141.1 outer membrane protein [Bacteroidales bacterium]